MKPFAWSPERDVEFRPPRRDCWLALDHALAINIAPTITKPIA